MNRTRNRDTRVSASSGAWSIKCSNPGTAFTLDGLNWPNGVRTVTVPSIGSSRVGVLESFTDITGPIDTAIKPYRDAMHTKDNWECPGRSCVTSWTTPHPHVSGQTVTWWTEGPNQMSWLLAEYNQYVLGILPRATLEQYATNQLEPGKPGASFDLPRFIGELTDLEILWKGVAKRVVSFHKAAMSNSKSPEEKLETIKGLFFAVGENAPRGAIMRSEAALSRVVGLDLARKFFVEPFVNDIGKMIKSWNNLADSLEKRKKGERVVLRGRANSRGSSNYGSTSERWYSHNQEVTHTREVVAWMMIDRDWSGVTPLANALNSFGIVPRLRTVFELMPLSFVLDWFVKVGRWLGQFDGSAITVPYKVISSGVSQRDTITSNLSIRILGGTSPIGGGLIDKPVLTGKRTNRTYQRTNKTLVFNSFVIQPLHTSLPNLGQVATLAELVYMFSRRSN